MHTPANDPRSSALSIQKFTGPSSASTTDKLAVEEPLEIQLAFAPPDARTTNPISTTMRPPAPPPAEDHELAIGFLFAEAIIHSPADIARIYHCGPETAPHKIQNVVRIE